MAVLNTTILPDGQLLNTTGNFSSDSRLEYGERIILQVCLLAAACSLASVLIEYANNHWNGRKNAMLIRIQAGYTLLIMTAVIFVVLRTQSSLHDMIGEVASEIFVYLIHLGTMAAYLMMNAGWLEIIFAMRKPRSMKFSVNYYAASATLIPVLAIVYCELVPQWYMSSSEDASTAVFTTPSTYISWNQVVSRPEVLMIGLGAMVLGNCGMTLARAAVAHLRSRVARRCVSSIAVILGGVAFVSSGLLVQLAPLDQPPTHAALVFLYVLGMFVSFARLCYEVHFYRKKKRANAEYAQLESEIEVRLFREVDSSGTTVTTF